jgi:large subunit ribosomal protein L4
MKLQIVGSDGSKGKEIDLPAFFETTINEHLLYEAVKCFLANQRQGTAKSKGRSEVSGGGVKPWRQKGTGRARSGSNTSPIWKRGGKAHGPQPHLYKTSFNKKARKKAITIALSLKAGEGNVTIIDAIELQDAKTKSMVQILKNIGIEKQKSLLVLNQSPAAALRAGRNIKFLKIKPVHEITVYDVMNCQKLIFTKESLDKVIEVYGS